ncbi:helix-turn-helix transcriptional regulator [Microbulbifer sp. TYP-18]|uniref:helix-turn-helix transcriptional regulator n=1 Tax=Microbulbifer sp. TYP-18 TaxID=3230024 RepID=UPI0034C66DE2
MPILDAAWSRTLAGIIDKDFNNEAIGELLRELEQLLDSSPGMVLRYPKGRGAQVTHDRLQADENRSHHVALYENAAYVLDPYYRSAIDRGVEGVFSLSDVAPAGFEQSEYFSLYYQQTGLIDEICYLFKDSQGTLVSVSLARRQSTRVFSAADLRNLKTIEPVVRSILLRWSQAQSHDNNNFEEHLDQALQNFGQSILTPKECDIVYLLLHGHSMRSVAQKLDNSQETIKHHRKNIYQKLDISSQSELFYLFIDSVRTNAGHRGTDPLEHYFQA